MSTAKRPIRRITFDDVPEGPKPARDLQSIKSGPNHLAAKMDADSVSIEIKLQLPVAKNGTLRQDLLQTLRILKEAEKFVTQRRKFFDQHVRERLEAKMPIEDGLLIAALVANRHRSPDWKARATEMHAKLLRATKKLTEKDASTQAAAEANRFFEGTEYNEYAPKVSVKVRK